MERLRLNRPIFAALHDLFMAALSFVLSLYLRLGDATLSYAQGFIVEGTLLFTAISGLVFWRMGLYRALWRYASVDDLVALTKSVTLAVLIFVPVFFLMTRLDAYPRSAALINWFVLLALLGGPRFVYRMIKDGGFRRRAPNGGDRRVPVLLVGAGDQAELFIREMGRRAREAEYRVVAVVDDRAGLRGAQIHGIRVMGRVDAIPEVVARLAERGARPRRLILTERVDGETVRRLLDQADALGMTLARLPRLTEFRAGDDAHIALNPIAVEDLLGRPQTVLDRAAMRAFIAGRRVLVTGAGGTIGSELARQIASFGPAHLTLFENAEFNLYRIDGELGRRHPGVARATVLGDVRDRARIDAVFAAARPEVVFHAAAFKHVPMVEANPSEGVLTNVAGTRNLADACRAAGVRAMVMISTDKAVNPTSVMGATKRIAELYCQAQGARLEREGTRFVTVRFGNVLDSTGSVVPLFRRQIAEGGPLTVTHPEMTRFFMTVREAVELVLQASALDHGKAGRGGEIFVLDMGEPVRIDDLARQMIRLAGLRPDKDIEIVYSGIRPGEKLHEALFHDRETRTPTAGAGVMIARSIPNDLAALLPRIDALEAAARAGRDADLAALIQEIVPEYRPTTGAERAIAQA